MFNTKLSVMWLVKKEMEDRRTQCWRAAEARPEKGLQMGPATQRGGHQEMGTPLSGVQYSSFINCCQWWDYESASSGTVLNFTFLILIAFLKGCTSLYSEWVKMLVFSLSPVVANLLLLSHSVVSDSDSMDYSPPASSVHRDSPGQNTGLGCHFLQGIFLTQESNPGLQYCRRILYCLSHQGSPIII